MSVNKERRCEMEKLAKLVNQIVNLILGEGVSTSASDVPGNHPEQFLNTTF